MSDKKMFSYGGIFKTKKTFLEFLSMKPSTRYRKYFSDFLPIKSLKKFLKFQSCYT